MKTMGKIRFVLDEQSVEAHYELRQVGIGSIVHVSKTPDDDIMFSPASQLGSVPHCVTWISPSDWTVFLESSLTVAEHDVKRVSSALIGALPEADVRKALYFTAMQVPVECLHLGDAWHSSIPGKCLAVAERLHLVSDLQRPEVEKVLWCHSDSLITYLLLTCFDNLGQSTGWSDFGNWLNTRRTKGGPNSSQLKANDPIDAARELHEQWLQKFGTRRSFYRFINETLDEVRRNRLLNSVEIIKYPLPPLEGAGSRQSRIPTTDADKLQYLYKIRNSFTHEARAVPGQYPETRQIVRSRGQAIEKDIHRNYVTTDWPDVLVECVKFGLLTVLRKQLALAPSNFLVPEKLGSGPGRRSYA
jgi:hypothetical protein